jgi:hypothetical protein
MKMGMDNFNEIAEQYLQKKPSELCEGHYYSFYYKNQQDFLPSFDNDSILLQRHPS